MFDVFEFAGSKNNSIALQTRLSTDIPNEQAPAPSEQALRIAALLSKQHPNWQERRPPCGIYNCAGHVWAGRRTAVYEHDAFATILREDGYRLLPEGEMPYHADLVIYRLKKENTILHVGVVQLRTGFSAATPIPWALSKWNDCTGEFFHHIEQVAFDGNIPREQYDIEYWTDR